MMLVGRYRSPFARRVAISLKTLGIHYEHKRITAWGNLKEMRSFNPVGRVPALVLDDGDVLFDSNAILDHLDQIAGPDKALIPLTEPGRRKIMRLVVAAMGGLEKMVHSVYERTMHPAEKVHQPWIDHNLSQTREALAWLETRPQSPWLESDRLTQADITTAIVVDLALNGFPEAFAKGSFPKLEALRDRVAKLPAWQETIPPEEELRFRPSIPTQA